MIKYLSFIGLLVFLISPVVRAQSFDTYMNPVIPGDHPDATLTRIGNDFYTTGSSFNVTPVIYHSTDLVHWEVIAQPVKASWSGYGDNPGGGCWGGHVVFYHDKYWHYFSRGNTMHFTTADQPEGPWSDPIVVNNPPELPYGLGYDNSIFIDDDDKWYLVVKNGQPNGGIVELGNDGQPTGVVYDLNWLNPAPDYPYSWAEGPVMWKYEGYYYYSFARDLAGGQKVMRSDTLTAYEEDWEMLGDFFNENDPLKPTSLFTSPNHASPVVMLDDNTHWVVHPLYAKGEWKGQGRQGLMNQVHYDENLKPTADYPVDRYFTAPVLPSSGIPWMVSKSDFFTSDNLNPEWSFLGYTPDNTWSLTDRPGWLYLAPKNTNNRNTLIKNDGEHNYSLITRLESNPENENDKAGLWVMRGDETSFLKLYRTLNEYNRDVIVFSFDSEIYELDNTFGNIPWLKIVRVNHVMTGYVSSNGFDWVQVGGEFNISSIDSYSDYSTFTGTRQGLFVEGSEAYFDLYVYRDAYSPILAECPANQFGTKRTNKTDGIYQLDSIQNNDWALYAGVEFGNDEYRRIPKNIEITASSAGPGGTVEVWLDSIADGTLVAECDITSTGDWNSFEVFSAEITPVEGRHDVYLHFTGEEGERLFILKWIQFTGENAPEAVKAWLDDEDTLFFKLSQPVLTPSLPSGLSIMANSSEDIPIQDISLGEGDSTILLITLSEEVTSTDEMTLSYSTGTIQNKAGIELIPFNEFTIDNRLPVSIPQIKLIETKNKGDTLWMYLSKNMNPPDEYAGNFSVGVEGGESISIQDAGLSNSDSSVVFLIPDNHIYYEDLVTLSYNGTLWEAANGGILETFNARTILNLADGYPPQITGSSVRLRGSEYKYIDINLDKPMMNIPDQDEFFSISINDEPATIYSLTIINNLLTFYITPSIQYEDTITLSYSGGEMRTRYNGRMEDISNYEILNTIAPNIIDMSSNSDFSEPIIFPNPTLSDVQITWETGFTGLTVHNMEGKKLVNKNFNSPQQAASISLDLDPGIYFLQLNNKEQNYFNVQKLIIE